MIQMKSAYPARCRAAAAIVLILSIFLFAACGASGAVPEEGHKGELKTAEWFYEHFDEEHRNAYDAFRRSASDPFGEELTAITDREGRSGGIAAAELDSVYQGFLYDHPELFWLDRTYRFRIRGTGDDRTADAVGVISLCGSGEEIGKAAEEFTDAADVLLKQLGTPAGSVKDPGKIYDLLAGHTAFTEEAVYDNSLVHAHTAYGAIVEGSAVCDGYALALKYLMGRCGIECIVIPGTVNGAAHVWNTAFWDGRWHEMDITWDAAGNSGRQYFDLTTDEMEKDHSREPEGIGIMIPVSEVRDAGPFTEEPAL